MPRNGDVNEPTRELPEYVAGRAAPQAGEAVGPAAGGHGDDAPVPASPRWRGRGLVVLIGVLGLVAGLALGGRAVELWEQWRNPFAEQRTDRSQPPLLKSIQDLSRYVAAEGSFQVVIDLEKDRRYVPDFLLSERTLFVGAGTVEAYVDFSQIAEGAVIESPDQRSAEIRLPDPQLSNARLDLESSYVFAEERGLLNRLGEVFGGDPNRQREVYRLAEERIAAAARESGLVDRARENTRKMLEGLLRSLGYEQVTITFHAP